jgi:hypothetical protein
VGIELGSLIANTVQVNAIQDLIRFCHCLVLLVLGKKEILLLLSMNDT